MQKPEVVIIGAGIVGLATAMRLQQRHPERRIAVVETEKHVAAHQTGHNSGVLHSGIYYKPGSLKAINCRAGKLAMEEFCTEHAIPWDRCGKVVVATNQAELPRLDRIAERATANGVAFERIDTDQLRELEPAAAGIAALHVPETGIVNFRSVCEQMSSLIRDRGGDLKLEFQVTGIEVKGSSVKLTSHRNESLECERIINCGGLQSDRICRLAGGDPQIKIVPFRGEYYELGQNSQSLCRNLIYPVPDPAFPFLGVHFTRMIDGGVECGPNAVFALSRSGYSWWDVRLADLADAISYRGFRSLAWKHWRMGMGEVHRSLSKSAFVKALQKLIPQIRSSDLVTGRAGVRAQAVTQDGNLFDDFLIEKSDQAIHVLNAPSPAATSAIAIADHIVARI
ncbi:MAG: L-2-hydroxyglutarate oxidase [Rubripirellula sp.]|nr:L-2-hydroxyglutarate oxidase [Rubripirellula sp.]